MLRKAMHIVVFLLCIIVLFELPVKAEEAVKDSDGVSAAGDTKKKGEKIALLETAPQLIYVNRRYPKFYGDKNTIHGGFFERSYLCGDWGSMRNTLVDHGIYIDIGLTQIYQWNVSGGRDIGGRYEGSGDLWINIDTGKAGLWSGGDIFLHAEALWGNSVQGKVGSLMPLNQDSTMPALGKKGASSLSEFYLIQGLPGNLLYVIGKINLASLADTNQFANNERTQFLNTSLVNNPILGVFAPYTSFATGPIWTAPNNKHEVGAFYVNNEESAMTSGFSTLSVHNATFGSQYAFLPTIGGKQGNYRIIGVYTSRDQKEYGVSDRILWRDLRGVRPKAMKTDNYGVFFNFDQYLYTKEGRPGAGWGIFGRAGWTPKDRNVIDQFYSFGLGGTGCLIPGRESDQWGLGWAGTRFSSDFRDGLSTLAGVSTDSFEHAIETFYSIKVTSAIHFSLDAQYILDPFSQAFDIAGTDNHAFVFGSRLQCDF